MTQEIYALIKEELQSIKEVQVKQGKTLARIEEHTKNTNGSVGRAFKEIDVNRKKIDWNRTILLLGLGGLYAITTILSVLKMLNFI